MGKIRKWLISNFILEYWFNVFGKHVKSLRAGRILFPLTGFVGLIITLDPLYPKLQWWDIILLIIWAIMIDFGFSWFPFSYFKKYPAKVSELDDEQRQAHYRARMSGELTNSKWKKVIGDDGNEVLINTQNLTPEEWEDFDHLTEKLEEEMKTPFAKFYRVLPLLIAIVAVILSFMFIFPALNPDWMPDPNAHRFF